MLLGAPCECDAEKPKSDENIAEVRNYNIVTNQGGVAIGGGDDTGADD